MPQGVARRSCARPLRRYSAKTLKVKVGVPPADYSGVSAFPGQIFSRLTLPVLLSLGLGEVSQRQKSKHVTQAPTDCSKWPVVM